MTTTSTGYAGRRSRSTAGLGCTALIFTLLLVGCGKAFDQQPAEQGTVVPIERLPTDPDSPYPPAVVSAIERLAEELGAKPQAVEVVSYDEVDWPDGCLGLPRLYEACTEAVTPGWRVILSLTGEIHTFRTDAVGAELREE
ncbi:MAG: hypothetical protein ACRDHG_07660 [Anaerolineales bacterium]